MIFNSLWVLRCELWAVGLDTKRLELERKMQLKERSKDRAEERAKEWAKEGDGVGAGWVDEGGTVVFIQRAGANSSKVCVGAGVYGQGAVVYRQNQK